MQTMRTTPRKPAPAPARASRQDGDATRQQLLDVAGQVFAERGFADATSKEICARAKANLAAVNYHFGSRDQLYEAVLVVAHQHMVKLDDLHAIAAMPMPPRDKLRLVITQIISKVMAPDAHWGMRVVIRELLAPTPYAATLVNKAIFPKAMVMFGIVAEILQLPPTSPGLQRSILFVMGPCLAMLIAPPGLRQKVFPSAVADAQSLADDMLCYALAGLEAIRSKYHSQ
jgi:AcrR family transcriptional regulator